MRDLGEDLGEDLGGTCPGRGYVRDQAQAAAAGTPAPSRAQLSGCCPQACAGPSSFSQKENDAEIRFGSIWDSPWVSDSFLMRALSQ